MIKLLLWLTENRPIRFIDKGQQPYLQRYYLGALGGTRFYLHRFMQNDINEEVHNHPWSWGFSLVLWGSYLEDRLVDICPHANLSGCITKRRRVRWFNWIPPNRFHRIVEAKSGTWTLMVHGKPAMVAPNVSKGWGFLKQKISWLVESSPLCDGKHTVFIPMQSKAGWWETAPLARDVER